MNSLPDDVLDKIFKYKHEIEYAKVMEDLIQHKINCRYNVTIGMLTYMFYLNEEGVQIPSIELSDIEIFSFEILSRIRSNIYYNSI
jgi:uncharacterized radical SAM superfamily Fe-S cluster-containing enzyme